ncbi:uncharacterized protein Z520_00341 [Fonsecaea multimorphosa CBS 102226]|uniref:AB hydrolase-1 domain-containing protein n=1 Tax=Fonsecaea multimorphosa CBS 102226 TaxID=1442371 RepID=A0A0D2KJI2_9EURO|nr:uncharacterized protein Z520_00341 [Fonsecaea multimorphosa CBS 102226]KIY03650.1 hypothetical protein Z520_00341 [Fonsecaea multimorphosa CBS 102226]OAL32349.1 hypothetical protein AYO22_00371 [Fonsecaea multimorphosa]
MAFDLKTAHSKDGTKIAFYQIGKGPGIIILHGAMQHGLSHVDLAKALSESFTCYLPDRRGRGRSGVTGKDYSVRKEVEDVEAIHLVTGAKFIFGVSSGALITLSAALAAPASHIQRIAVFEPPWRPESDREGMSAWVQRYQTEIDRGELAKAAVTAMLGAEMGPAIFRSRYFPQGLLVLLTKVMMAFENKPSRESTNGEYAEPLVKDLIPTVRNDFEIAMSMLGEETLQKLASIQTETLILGGSRSQAYLKNSVRELEKILPNAARVEFEGLDHGGTCNKAQHGSPEVFAAELRRFFSQGNGKHDAQENATPP